MATVPQHTKMVSVFSDSVLFHTKLCDYWPVSWNCKHYRETLCIFEVRFAKFLNRRANNVSCEQRLHFRGMSGRAKSSFSHASSYRENVASARRGRITKTGLIDLNHDTLHLCTRFWTDEMKVIGRLTL